MWSDFAIDQLEGIRRRTAVSEGGKLIVQGKCL